ncbi:MAG: DUF499 domain-containing protein [Anaerolineae bacterium]|nr:DUF499 domain-containing protein [Anaerolineae bacterium]
MPRTARDYVNEILDSLKVGLCGYVLREYKDRYGAERYLGEIVQVLQTGAYTPPPLPDEAAAARSIDAQGWLNLISRRWEDIFRSRLGQSERSYVMELIDWRNKWAHQQPLSLDEAYRMADTAARLLRVVGAANHAEAVDRIAKELLKRQAEEASAQQRSTTPSSDQSMSHNLPSWRQVIFPHPDVASGRYIQAEFAANLAEVLQGTAAPEYSDPAEFFRRTYLTEGLAELLAAGIKRLTGQSGEPVIQLQTNFGGGKTHSMLALYHLCSGKIKLSDVLNSKTIRERVGTTVEHLQARRAVIVGTAFDPNAPRQYPDCTVRTLWGEIAYQLGGVAAYSMVEAADLNGTSPGSDTLVQLLDAHSPALILIDELVAFARNLYGVQGRLTAGAFDSVMTFMQALTEAVKRSKRSILLISIPESDIEVGGEGGRAVRDQLLNVIGRLESVWKPITATESYEVVRRRLFSSEINYAERERVIAAFYRMYQDHKNEFPSEVTEGSYLDLMRATYPIHPELFTRLYSDWSTLERFQRTRGVLRLMAAVIHHLWQAGDSSPMILPASLPLNVPSVRNELLRYLPEGWSAVMDTDIDGEQSKPQQLDIAVPTLGQRMASRRVARAVFVGSAPSVAAQRARGIEESRIRLAVAQPGDPLPIFNDALRRMSSALTYLYTDGVRYWYDTRPTLNRLARDRALALSDDEVLRAAAEQLKAVPYRGYLTSAPVVMPRYSGEVPDQDSFQVIVFGPRHGHRSGMDSSEAQQRAKEFFENRGNSPRYNRNMLVFVAPDAALAKAWEETLREYLAWQSIQADKQLNLDRHQEQQVKVALERAKETVQAQLEESYAWLIVPVQPEATELVRFEAHSIRGSGNLFERVARRLHDQGLLVRRWTPESLVEELERYLWRDQPHLHLQKLWGYLTQYCYLPRLSNQSVLLQAIGEGVAKSEFGYAKAAREDGKYEGLVLGGRADVRIDDQSVIVRAEVARAQLEAMRSKPSAFSAVPPSQVTVSSTRPSEESVVAPPPRLKTRYYGLVDLNPEDMSNQVQEIAEEIVRLLTNVTDTRIRIELTIDAERLDGFDEKTMRDLSENSRTLKFRTYGFTG